MFEDAILAFDKAKTLSGGSPICVAALGHADAVAGKRAERPRTQSGGD